ncbi:MAG: TetR/AcrR family transcriptional regulator [Rubrivivax sp.]|nr:MAG: TetR/AcrR family transcriptional regulator [Rubrivivax sp.]
MNPPDHRVRVAAERRQRMRERLMGSALHVFAQQGLHATVIDDVIKAADVSRGTFYKYFRTNDELVEAISVSVGDYLIRLIDPVVQEQKDPALRVACGVRLCLMAGRTIPDLARFVVRAAWQQSPASSLAQAYLSRDIQSGMEAGRFDILNLRAALDLVFGAVMSALNSIAEKEAPEAHAEAIAGAILMSLGIGKAEARRLAKVAIPAIVLPWQTEDEVEA